MLTPSPQKQKIETSSRKSISYAPRKSVCNGSQKNNLITQRKSIVNIIEPSIASLAEKIRDVEADKARVDQWIKTELTFSMISYILSKSMRSQEEIQITKLYLGTIPRLLKILEIKANDHQDQLLFSWACLLRLERKAKNSMLFKNGEKGNKCFIVLQGKASVLIPKEKKCVLSKMSYLKHLLLLKLVEEDDLLSKIVNANKSAFYFDDKNIIELFDFLQSLSLTKNSLNQQNSLIPKLMQNRTNSKTSVSLITLNKEVESFIYQSLTLFEQREILEYFMDICSVFAINKNNITIDQYLSTTSPTFQEEIMETNLTMYVYYEVTQKYQGDIIGEIALMNVNNKRTGTIICTDDCVFGTLTRESYWSCINDIQIKKRRKNVNFILSFPLFKDLSWSLFESKYFNYFKIENFYQGQHLVRQGDKYSNWYFLKEGDFEVSSRLSVNEMNNIISGTTGKTQEEHCVKDNYSEASEYTEKVYYRWSKFHNKDIIGLQDFCYLNTYFATITCISSQASVYVIDNDIFEDIGLKFPKIYDNICDFIKERRQMINDRFMNIIANVRNKHKEKQLRSEEKNQILKVWNELKNKDQSTNWMKKLKNKINNPYYEKSEEWNKICPKIKLDTVERLKFPLKTCKKITLVNSSERILKISISRNWNRNQSLNRGERSKTLTQTYNKWSGLATYLTNSANDHTVSNTHTNTNEYYLNTEETRVRRVNDYFKVEQSAGSATARSKYENYDYDNRHILKSLVGNQYKKISLADSIKNRKFREILIKNYNDLSISDCKYKTKSERYKLTRTENNAIKNHMTMTWNINGKSGKKICTTRNKIPPLVDLLTYNNYSVDNENEVRNSSRTICGWQNKKIVSMLASDSRVMKLLNKNKSIKLKGTKLGAVPVNYIAKIKPFRITKRGVNKK